MLCVLCVRVWFVLSRCFDCVCDVGVVCVCVGFGLFVLGCESVVFVMQFCFILFVVCCMFVCLFACCEGRVIVF